MQLIVRGHHTFVTPAMREYATKKIGKLEQYFSNIQKAEVTLDVRSIDDFTKSQVAEVTIWAAGKKVIRASEAGQDMYASIDMVYEELERQIRKHKEKHQKEGRRKSEKIKEFLRRFIPMPRPEQGAVTIVSTSRPAKLMTPDEAKDEVKVFKQDFMLFLNPETKKVNLAYKNGGDYQVLDPEEADLKSLTAEQAADEVEEKGVRFVMFKNKDTDTVNVLYRRHSGNFGLIEPEL